MEYDGDAASHTDNVDLSNSINDNVIMKINKRWTAALEKFGLYKSKLKNTIMEVLQVLFDCHKQGATVLTDSKIIELSLIMVYNCSWTDSNETYNQQNTIEPVKWFIKNAKRMIETTLLVTLPHALDNIDESHIGEEEILFLLTEIITGALCNDDLGQNNSFSAKELVFDLTKLANKDTNSKLILQRGAVPKLMTLIKTGNMEEQTIAVNCIWALSFVEKNKAKLKEDEEFIKKLEALTNHSDKELKNAASGASWQLVEGDKKKQNSEKEEPRHLMLSYTWKNQPMVLKINMELQFHCYKVWIDTKDMSGDIMQAMAKAVEHAGVVIICMSKAYQESKFCRSEAEYAFNLGKPIIPLKMEDFTPSGWLGFITAGKLYIKFTDMNEFKESMLELIKEIKTKI